MTASRDLTIRLGAGEAEDLGMGELHLTISAYHPDDGAYKIMHVVTMLVPSATRKGAEVPLLSMRSLLMNGIEAVEKRQEEER